MKAQRNFVRAFRQRKRLQRVIRLINFSLFPVHKGVPAGIIFLAQHDEAVRRHRRVEADLARLVFRDFNLRLRRRHVLLRHLERWAFFQNHKLARIEILVLHHRQNFVARFGEIGVMHGISAGQRVQIFQQQRVGIHDHLKRLNDIADLDRLAVERRAFRQNDVFDVQQVNERRAERHLLKIVVVILHADGLVAGNVV